ncbi:MULTISPECIES: pilus assembly protein [unclassified Agarivorans]|uniref:pilus assembly protein n=1 Tax=unclassified Agarivorans TaxID=2636026 RepID=UPI0026E20487|nr:MULTISPECIES: PilC/PilY family type IV pilus protein [unclassified Agarivorans]MDO6687475.1 PilC/PilY family type IV pilus protein [Agarivorans sp. 3_MG-2023]MDO6715241.1 PilC/PilY family type IV pilus protein [Agarivorans sp. 2_MG-2023]
MKFLLKTTISSLAFSSVSLLSPAASLDLADAPLYTASSPPPLVMLVMGRDHTLYYEAYNDASDLDGDGELDIRYSPNKINYAGYFDSNRCYSYASGKFSPEQSVVHSGIAQSDSDTTNYKTCAQSGVGSWSGDFLNYLTMSRMDVLRKVLYGGYRSTDTAAIGTENSQTVLERVFIPQDAHSWGKMYTSVAVDKYNIRMYSPFSLPSDGTKHFFGTASFADGGTPQLRVRQEVAPSATNPKEPTGNIWEWASTERPVLSSSGRTIHNTFNVRVEVCVADSLEENCKEYSEGNYKPTGVLHDYGENGSIEFGLITGSYDKNLSGGVLRKAVGDFSTEVDPSSGVFDSAVNGIVSTINKLKIYGFDYGSEEYGCGWVATRAIANGECTSWGNPIGEMLYESVRYFHGENSASSSYSAGSGTIDASLGLPYATWDDPYENWADPAIAKRSYCAAPYNLVISDINPSYDSDELPGALNDFIKLDSSGNSLPYQGSELTDFDITDLLDTISTKEGISGSYFVGESVGDISDTKSAPTAKTVSSLSAIRGLSPAEPTKEGSYSVAGVAYYGHKTDLFPTKEGKQNINTMVVAISSPLPEVEVEVGDDVIKIVPFAKSVGGYSINRAQGEFQPTNTIVDYYVEEFSSTKGIFRINFEDVEQGADHDMDMIVQYTYEVKDLCPNVDDDEDDCTKTPGVKLTLDSLYAAGSIDQHAGYVISGTEKDGIYLDVKDIGGSKVNYYLDTPEQSDSAFPLNSRNRTLNANVDDLELTRTRHFFPNSSSANLLPSPLWYAAKWGGFEEAEDNTNHFPDAGEWDKNNSGEPDSYFPVTNAGELEAQIGKALESTFGDDQSSTSPVFNNTFLNSGAFLYQTRFEGDTWSGNVLAYSSNGGSFSDTPTWQAAEEIDAVTPSSRTIYTRNSVSNEVVDFVVPSDLLGADDGLSVTQIEALLSGLNGTDAEKLAYLTAVINYLRGERTYEAADLAYSMRERKSALGDIVNSTPYYVDEVNGHDVDKPVLVFGANDGMVHVIDVANGEEIMAYIPSQVYPHLNSLTKSSYSHKYFVDGEIAGYTDDSDKTIVVGTLGTGFKGLYAIDVSDMRSANKNKIKWEINSTDAGFGGLGFTREKPTIAKLKNGKVGVIFSNGYNSAEDAGTLYIADLDDGSLIKSLTVGSIVDPTGLNRPNALASPAVVDLNGDGIADRIYAGDLYGNMWVFNISDSNVGNWKIANEDDKPLFTAVSLDKSGSPATYISQAITTRPSVGVHPYGIGQGVLVAFGTGKYIEKGDNNYLAEPTQSIYAIWDKLDESYYTTSRTQVDSEQVYSNLLRQSIIEEDARNRKVSSYPIDWGVHKGWYLDLVNTQDDNTTNYGERQVTNSLLLANKLSFTTLLPNEDACTPGGSGWYMEMNLHSGVTWNSGNEDFTDPDDDTNTIDDESSHQKVDGIPSSPSVIIDPNLTDEGVVGEDGIIQKNCITLSNGSMFCYDDYESPTGRLSLRALH